jgi:acetylornithine/succinyldiaminopimelate/putrescine aminotransferase
VQAGCVSLPGKLHSSALDEVQTGVGRPERSFAISMYGIDPDAVTFAKELRRVFRSAAYWRRKAARAFSRQAPTRRPSRQKPICAAGATVSTGCTLTPKFLAEVTEKGAYIRARSPDGPARRIERARVWDS